MSKVVANTGVVVDLVTYRPSEESIKAAMRLICTNKEYSDEEDPRGFRGT